MAQKKHSRRIFTILVGLIVLGALGYAFWPRPVLVDIGEVARAPLQVTIDEEGRTRVHDTFVVSTPIAGRLLRVNVEPGDAVTRGDSVVARMLPASPAALDIRTREQAMASVNSAEAALRAAQADFNRARADLELSDSNLARTQKLFDSEIASQAALERDKTANRLALANLDTARAAISMRIAQLNNAQAQLISFDDQGLAAAIARKSEEVIEIHAPASGVILEVKQQSEITLPAGTPIMEIGDVEADLEIVAELLSTDAVRVQEGARVIIDNWGGPGTLEGVLRRIEPLGFTKYSALGVEEQRVRVVVSFTEPAETRAGLGHGFRVEIRVVVWDEPDALVIPSSSLFRDGAEWAVFRVSESGNAEKTRVGVAANNGVNAAISEGLAEGDKIILYPSASIEDGVSVARRQTEG